MDYSVRDYMSDGGCVFRGSEWPGVLQLSAASHHLSYRMVDSPLNEETLAATQPAISPSTLPSEGALSTDACGGVHATAAAERGNSRASPSSALSLPLSVFGEITGATAEAEERAAADLYPPLVPFLSSTSMTCLRRSSAHNTESTSTFRPDEHCTLDEVRDGQNDSARKSVLESTNENIDPAKDLMAQKQTQLSLTEKESFSVKSPSEEHSVSPRSSSPSLKQSDFAGSRETANSAFENLAVPEARGVARHEPEQGLDTTHKGRVRSRRYSTSSDGSSMSDTRLREETRRNTEKNASPLRSRHTHTHLQQSYVQFRSLGKRSSVSSFQRTAPAASASAPVTPVRFSAVSWQQCSMRLDRHTPPKPRAAFPLSPACTEAVPSAVATLAVATATPTADHPTAGVSPVKSILRAASACTSARSISSRRVIFTPLPKRQSASGGGDCQKSPWADQPAEAMARTDSDAPPAVFLPTALVPTETEVGGMQPGCNRRHSVGLANSSDQPRQQQQEHQCQQQQGTPASITARSEAMPLDPQSPFDNLCRVRTSHYPVQGEASESQLQNCNYPAEDRQHRRQTTLGSRLSSKANLEAQEAAEELETSNDAEVSAAETEDRTEFAQETAVTGVVTSVELSLEVARELTIHTPSPCTTHLSEAQASKSEASPAKKRIASPGRSAPTTTETARDGVSGKETNGELGRPSRQATSEGGIPIADTVPEVTSGRSSAETRGEAQASVGDGGTFTCCCSSTRVLVVSSEGETELLLHSASCLVAPAMSEPLHADPTPQRKAPARPLPEGKSRTSGGVAVSNGAGAPSPAASVQASAAAAAEKKPHHTRDEAIDSHRDPPAAAAHFTQQHQHEQDPLHSTNDSTSSLADSGSEVRQQTVPFTLVDAPTYGTAIALPPVACLKASFEEGEPNGTAHASLPSGTGTEQILVHQQQQQRRGSGIEAELDSPSTSDISSTPLTPFAGPDPLSGDAPLSPRLAVPTGGGGSRIVSTSAMSFLLSVRHQLEAEAAVQQRRQEQKQQGPLEQRHTEDAALHDVHERGVHLCDGATNTEESPTKQQEQQQGRRQLDIEKPQPHFDAVPNGSCSYQQQRCGDSVKLQEATSESNGGALTGGPSTSNCCSNDRVCEASRSPLGSPKESRRESDASAAAASSTNSHCHGNSSEIRKSVSNATADKATSISVNPQWRTQWRALNALTNKLLQGLPRALTVIAEGDNDVSPVERTSAAETPSKPVARDTHAKPAAEAQRASPCISWVDFREERLQELQLSEKQHQDIATQGNMHERGDEASEIQEFLSQRLMKRGASFAAAEAEQLLTQRAKTRREWEEVYEKTQEVLQQQLRDHTEPLFQQTSQDFKQLGEALEVASSQTERAAEAKRLRLSKESWESSFIAMAEERHFALQSAAKNVDGTAASLGHFLEQETQLAEEIAAMEAEIRGFDDASSDLRVCKKTTVVLLASLGTYLDELLADIRHKESIVEAFGRLSGVRIHRVSTTGLVAELAWPRSLPSVAALQLAAGTCGTDAVAQRECSSSPFHGPCASADYPVASTRIAISWDRQAAEPAQMLKRSQPAPQLASVPTKAAAKRASQIPAAATDSSTPLRQRVQIMRPCFPPGGPFSDFAVCTPLLAPRRGRAQDAGAAVPDAVCPAPGASAACQTGVASRRHQADAVQGTVSEPRFLPITSCKLQSRFPVLRAAAAAATATGAANGDALPPHKRWMFTVDLLRYFLLGAVQRSLQQMLQQQRCRGDEGDEHMGAATTQDSFGLTSAESSADRFRHDTDMRGFNRSDDMSNWSSAETGSSSAAGATDSHSEVLGAPPFPNLSVVRALLLHAHAAAGRVALLHDQLLLVLHSFTSVTSVSFEDQGLEPSLPHLIFKTFLAPSNDELPVLQLSLTINLSEALSRGSLLLAVESVDVKCLSAVDDLCSDGQRVCRALHGTIQSRLKALWDPEQQQPSVEGCMKAFSDQGLVECLYSACDEAGYTCAVEDWQRSKFESSYTGDANDSVKFVSRGAEEATALGRWAAVLEGAEVVSLLH